MSFLNSKPTRTATPPPMLKVGSTQRAATRAVHIPQAAKGDKADSILQRLSKHKTPEAVSRRNMLNLGVAGMFAGCACDLCGTAPAKADAWGYGMQKMTIEQPGTSMWGGQCASGAAQSPVDIRLKDRVGTTAVPTLVEGKITCMYSTTEQCSVINTGHGTMQVSFPPGNRITIGNQYLELLQFHFHTPSEHAMDGRRFPMEVHLVHRDLYNGDLTVLGVMLERCPKGGSENECVRLALDCAPDMGQSPVSNKFTTFNPTMLLPATMRNGKRNYINYTGSLTTPPCSEKVNWYVFTDPIRVTDSEILDFQEYAGAGMSLGMNARPVQDLNGRTFNYYEGI